MLLRGLKNYRRERRLLSSFHCSFFVFLFAPSKTCQCKNDMLHNCACHLIICQISVTDVDFACSVVPVARNMYAQRLETRTLNLGEFRQFCGDLRGCAGPDGSFSRSSLVR